MLSRKDGQRTPDFDATAHAQLKGRQEDSISGWCFGHTGSGDACAVGEKTRDVTKGRPEDSKSGVFRSQNHRKNVIFHRKTLEIVEIFIPSCQSK